MGRGPLSQETIEQRNLEKAKALLAKLTGKTVEEVADEIKYPDETTADLMREAQSVIYFFEAKGEGFKRIVCKTCREYFAYCWDVNGVAYCGVNCMKIALQKIGIEWTPGKPASERWGRYVPAVVPPRALEAIQEVLETQELQTIETHVE